METDCRVNQAPPGVETRNLQPAAAILYLDVEGYSKLDDVQLSAFHREVMPSLFKKCVEGKNEDNFVFKDTWGDAIILIHHNPYRLICNAIVMCEYFNNPDFTNQHVDLRAKPLRVRIALHHASYYLSSCPFQNRIIPFCRQVIRGSRIEPIVPPGYVCVTAQMKYQVEQYCNDNSTKHNLRFESLGEKVLAKAFDIEEIFVVLQRGKDFKSDPKDEEKMKEGTTVDPKVIDSIKYIAKNVEDESDFQKCYKLTDDICSLSPEALCISSELLKGVLSMDHVRGLTLCLTDLKKIVHHILDRYKDEYRNGCDSSMIDLGNCIRSLRKCLEHKRNDEEEDYAIRLEYFLHNKINKNMPTQELKNAILNIGILTDSYPSQVVGKPISEADEIAFQLLTEREIHQQLRCIRKNINNADIILPDVAIEKIDEIKKSIDENFRSYSSKNSLKHFSNCRSQLSRTNWEPRNT